MPISARIVSPKDVEQRIGGGDNWTGPIDGRRVNEALGTSAVLVNWLSFEPGVRSLPHSHSHDQILLYTSGRGVVAVDGGEDQVVETGQFVLLPADVAHVHGADGRRARVARLTDVGRRHGLRLPDPRTLAALARAPVSRLRTRLTA